ncbi:MAG: four helix bundle protein [Dissulfuribacterales bacterium]
MVKSYRDLEVWQKSMDLVVTCYQMTRRFPKSEIYGLTSQSQRAAVSVPSNIAEGRPRQHSREFLRKSIEKKLSCCPPDPRPLKFL